MNFECVYFCWRERLLKIRKHHGMKIIHRFSLYRVVVPSIVNQSTIKSLSSLYMRLFAIDDCLRYYRVTNEKYSDEGGDGEVVESEPLEERVRSRSFAKSSNSTKSTKSTKSTISSNSTKSTKSATSSNSSKPTKSTKSTK